MTAHNFYVVTANHTTQEFSAMLASDRRTALTMLWSAYAAMPRTTRRRCAVQPTIQQPTPEGGRGKVMFVAEAPRMMEWHVKTLFSKPVCEVEDPLYFPGISDWLAQYMPYFDRDRTGEKLP